MSRVPSPSSGVTVAGESCTDSWEDITPPSSLLRTHAPIPLTLPSFGDSLRSRSLGRSLPAPAVSGIFPTLSLRILPRMPGPLPRRVPQSAHTCFFLRVIGLPQQGCGSASPLLPANTIFRGAYFRGCRHFFMFKPTSLLTSQIVPTPAQTAAGQLRLLRPSRTCFVTSACIGYACRPNTGNWRHRDFHPARFAALSAAPPCLRFTGHFAAPSAKLGAERIATPFS